MSVKVDHPRRGSLEIDRPRRPSSDSDRPRRPNLGISSRNAAASSHKVGLSLASKELKDILERKIEDLSRQLAEQKQNSRQDKMAAARLQREITRLKSINKPGKESVTRELGRERMLRGEAEAKLTEMTRDSENCRHRLQLLQGDFNKMEEVVQGMMQYKVKVDQVKHEKASLSVTYENNLQKFGAHIAELERENMVLLNEVKKLELQIDSKPDGRDKSKLLLERLRILEGENSSLVLENEQQRGQYETCLDEIANQVVQALLAQKMLREECLKLQTRVCDLELQNYQLNTIFQQKMQVTSEAFIQMSESNESLQQDVCIEGSIESMQSIFSEQMSEKQASMLRVNSLSPWLQERLPADRLSLISIAGSVQSTPELHNNGLHDNEISCHTRIETEFPATPSSPKVKRINVFEQKCEAKRSSSVSSLSVGKRPSKLRTQSTSSLSRAQGLRAFSTHNTSQSHHSGLQNTTTSETYLPTHATNQGYSTESSSQSELGSPVATTTQLSNKPQPVLSRLPPTRVPAKQLHTAALETSQEHNSRLPSKLPKQAAVVTKDLAQGCTVRTHSPALPAQSRKNTLKSESGIKMGCQSPVSSLKHSQSGNVSSKLKLPQSRSPSVPTPARSSPVTTERSQSVNTRIPAASRTQTPSSGSNILVRSSSKGTVSQSKAKTAGSKPVKHTNSGTKDSAPVKHTNSGTKVSGHVKHGNTVTSNKDSGHVKHTNSGTSNKDSGNVKSRLVHPSAVRASTPKNENANIKPVSAPETKVSNVNRVSAGTANLVKSRTIPVPTYGQILSKPTNVGNSKLKGEYRYPRMGTTNLNCSSPKNEDTPKVIYTTSNISKASIPPTQNVTAGDNTSGVYENVQGQVTSHYSGQYFYDYSDEDSDFNRPVSKDFSIASTVSLDELLDQTLENIETPVEADYSSQSYFLETSPYLLSGDNASNRSSSSKLESETTPTCDSDKSIVKMLENCENQSQNNNYDNKENQQHVNKHELRGMHDKPDIVKDTEECEQRNMKKSLKISQIPGSDLPGYRARRPKSLILGSKEKKFLYCEYGSSSSADSSSDEEWSYKFSYAKNIKQQEIHSKVTKSLKMGQAKAIENPTKVEPKIQPPSDKIDKDEKPGSQIPRSNMFIKPLKSPPPPVARKPVRKKVSPTSDCGIPRPNSVEVPTSVEICVNTVLAPTITSGQTTCYSYLSGVDVSKRGKLKGKMERRTITETNGEQTKLDNQVDSSFDDDVKVERTGSKDDGYSTMSSDVQPEMMEKYSDSVDQQYNEHNGDETKTKATKTKQGFDIGSDPDSALESSTHSNDTQTSNHSLSSQNSYSSEDRPSLHGSLGRVRAMKMKFEIENRIQSPEREILSSPTSPPKSPHRSPKTNLTEKLPTASSKLPMPKSHTTVNINVTPAGKSNSIKTQIPMSKTSTNVNKANSPVQLTGLKTSSHIVPPSVMAKPVIGATRTVNSGIPAPSKLSQPQTQPQNIPVYAKPRIGGPSELQKDPVNHVHHPALSPDQSHYPPLTVDQVRSVREDQVRFAREGSYDSSSSASDRGSDLTSLHISEDNILSDIPEEKDEYESSIGQRSENPSLSSLLVKKGQLPVYHTQLSHTTQQKFQFKVTLKRHWESLDGLTRAVSDSDIVKQKHDRKSADYDEMYGGSLNIDTPLERSSSEADIHVRDSHNEPILRPGLQRRACSIDDIGVEGRVKDILKQMFMQQITKSAESADKDDVNFTSFVELLIQRGHILDTCSPQECPDLGQMAISSCSSSRGHNSHGEEGHCGENSGPTSNQQKQFNSQFYSLCDVGTVGSSKSISENSENVADVMKDKTVDSSHVHVCKTGDKNCKKCVEESTSREFDTISRQIESLSKTVNALHRSLSSLNSDNNDSGSESNEGDHSSLLNSLGDKEFDGYEWLQDEFYLNPHGGEIILGSSPFSNTGASCEWMDNYTDKENHLEEMFGERECLHDDMSVMNSKQLSLQPRKGSILNGAIDKDGNFNSQEFISQRLRQAEVKLKETQTNGITPVSSDSISDLAQSMNKARTVLSNRPFPSGVRMGTRPLVKEDLRTTPEKDMDDSDIQNLEGRQLLLDSLINTGSQDSLDDNIGVDHVMCHRLLGKSKNEAIYSNPNVRPGLDFSPDFYTRYGESEQEAVAAFDFLNDMTTSASSNQSNEQQASHDQIFTTEDRKVTSNPRMSQSTSSTDSPVSPIKKLRRKLRPKIAMPQSVNARVPVRNHRKCSSTSPDSANDASCDEFSVSDSCCDSFSLSEDEREVIAPVESVNTKTNKTYV